MKEVRSEKYTTEWCGGCNEVESPETISRASHIVEKDLAHHLAARPDVEFDRLVVRRISGDAVCLEGVVKVNSDELDLDSYVKALYGVDVVINRLVNRVSSSEETDHG